MKQYRQIRAIARTQAITWTVIIFGVLWFLGLMVTSPGDWDASAAYTDTAEPAHGLVDVVPHFAGLEEGESSESIHFVNEYGTCGWEVNECWLADFLGPGGGGIWQPDIVRGNPVADLIAVHQGRPAVIYDWTSTDYLEMGTVLNIESFLYTVDGVMSLYGTDAAFELRVYEDSVTPSTGSTDFVFVYHDGAEGSAGTSAGDFLLNAADDVYTYDNLGVGTNAPSEALHVVGTPRFVTGAEGVGTIWGDDGTGTGVGEWLVLGTLAGVWIQIAEGNVIVAGADPTQFVGGVIAGGVEDVAVLVTCRAPNGGVGWHAFSHPTPVADMVTYYWTLQSGTNNLIVNVVNDGAVDVLATVQYSEI